MLTHEKAYAVAEKLTKEGRLMGYSDAHKAKAAQVVFDELHQWSSEKLPVGASADASEEYLRHGLKAVRNKLQHSDAHEFEQANGFPLLLVLGLIPTLVSWIRMLVAWWNGTDE